MSLIERKADSVSRNLLADGRPVEVEVDLSAVAANVRAIKRSIGPSCNIMAVVKANGYGLGAVEIAQAALEGGATWLAVACVDEGVQLRQAGLMCPVLLLGYVQPGEARRVVEHGLTAIVHRIETAMALDEAARALGMGGKSVPVHIKVDTGLGRFGCLPEKLLPLAQRVDGLAHLKLQGLMTHFADADSRDLSFAHEQLSRFNRIRQQAVANGLQFELIHAANSAAMLGMPEARFDLVRTGILLSGHLPAPHLAGKIELRPAVTFRARLARVFRASVGESVGYGRTWFAERPSVIGLVPVGYADGFRRVLSNRGEVLVHGMRCPVVGRVSMDQFAIDVTEVEGVDEGDEVVMIGEQGREKISADKVAKWADTISYEILTGLAPRVPRKYVADGVTVSTRTLLGGSDTAQAERAAKEPEK